MKITKAELKKIIQEEIQNTLDEKIKLPNWLPRVKFGTSKDKPLVSYKPGQDEPEVEPDIEPEVEPEIEPETEVTPEEEVPDLWALSAKQKRDDRSQRIQREKEAARAARKARKRAEMGITKEELAKIIKEEFAKVIKEMDDEDGEWADWAYGRFEDVPGHSEEAAGPPKVGKKPAYGSEEWVDRDRMRYSDQYDEWDAYQLEEEVIDENWLKKLLGQEEEPWPPRAPAKSHMWKDPETGENQWVTKDEHDELSASAEGGS